MRESYEIKKLKGRIILQSAFSIFSFALLFCELRAEKPSVLQVAVLCLFVYLPYG